ncbi:MAG TPA: amidohydrolase [Acidobacteriota bacterium]|nr:amidohydrolase [Acidobacteriota bacterium]
MRRKEKTLRISGGPIVTMDTEVPVVGEVVVCGGRIVWVGRNGSAPTAYGQARTIDLKGQLLLPAFTDSHTHFLVFAQSLSEIDLRGVPSLQAALARIRKYLATQRGEKGWVVGHGFDVNLWKGRRPSRHDLDRIVSNRPVMIWSHDQHVAWVNTQALRRCRIDGRTPNPPGGEIVHGTDGEPTGILLEAASELVWDRIPEPSGAKRERLLDDAQKKAHEVGVAAICDMGAPATLAGFTGLREKGKLSLRVWKSIPLAELDNAVALGLRTGLGDAWIKIGGVKIFLDGALGSQTALMYSPYTSNRATRGIGRLEPDALDRAVRTATRNGLSVCIHAIGDAAVGRALDVLLKYESRFPKNHPPRIEHLQVVAPKDLKRLAGRRIVASLQPSHLLTDRDYADQHWGKRARRAFAFRSLWDSGLTLAFGSDVPIEPMRPLDGIGAAVYRARPDDRRGSWYPQERLSVWEAVWGFTAGAAIATGDSDCRGKIIPGFIADLVVLDRNIFTIPPGEIFSTRVVTTIVDGQVVYGESD